MVQIIPFVASLLALSQAVAAAKAVTSFSEWVDGVLENPDGDNMTPDEVISAFESGQFNTPPSGISTVESVHCTSMKANIYIIIAKLSRSLYQKRATCYEYANTDCSVRKMNLLLKKSPKWCH
jgi:hypothetical protein